MTVRLGAFSLMKLSMLLRCSHRGEEVSAAGRRQENRAVVWIGLGL